MRSPIVLAVLATLALAGVVAPAAEAHNGIAHEGNSQRSQRLIVSLSQYRYSPAEERISVGDEIEFKNRDAAVHRVVSEQQSSADLKQAESWLFKPTEAGTILFGCKYHARMSFKLVVDPPRPPNHPPTVEITSPRDAERVSGTMRVTLKADDEDGNLATVRVRFAGGAWNNVGPGTPPSIDFDTTRAKDGEYLVEAAAQDRDAAYSRIFAIRVNVANGIVDGAGAGSQPTSADGVITITAPTPAQEMRGSFLVQGAAKAFDGPGTRVRVRVDGGDWRVAEGVSSWRLSLNTLNLTDGQHTIEAAAFSGEKSSSVASVRAFVGNLDPNRLTVRILTPGERTTVQGRVGIQGDLGGPDLQEVDVLVRVDGGPWRVADGVNPWSTTWDATFAPSGLHYIEAVAKTANVASAVARVTVQVVRAPAAPAEAASDDAEETKLVPLPAALALVALGGVAWVARRRE